MSLFRFLFSGTLLISCGMILVAGCGTDLPETVALEMEQLPEVISYNFHVRPILSEHCFSCHGPDKAKRKSGLRLDLAEEARKVRKSKLVHRILATDPEMVMPPPEAKLALSQKDKAILIRWMEQGAGYEKHWAFIPPVAPAQPQVQQKDWPENGIDHFVLARLEKNQLQPSPVARKEVLVRRLAFDLTGLPPSLETIDDFLADDTPGAYAKLVDRLLDSPAYGERMAAYWMEIARYADSDGYLDDKHRDFSAYRDWVIQAFNENMSYEQFVTWQLAGDLLPQPSKEQILATAFNRLHKKNSEAGIVLEEYRNEYVADRTNTFGKAFMGVTMECARCHSHKYDPISHEEYYGLFAFFNSTDEIGHAVYGPGITPGPSLLLTDEETDARIAVIERTLKAQEQQLARQLNQARAEATHPPRLNMDTIQQALEEKLQAYYPFDSLVTDKEGNNWTPNLVVDDQPARVHEPIFKNSPQGLALYNSHYSTTYLGEKVGWLERTRPFAIDFWIRPAQIYEEAAVFLHAEDWRLGYKGYGLHLENNHLRFIMAHAYPQNAIEVHSVDTLRPNEWVHLTINYDGSSTAEGVQLYIDGQPVSTRIVRDHLYKGILYEPDIHTYGFNGFQLGKRDGVKPMHGGAIDELRIFQDKLSDLEVLSLHQPEKVAAMLRGQEDPFSAPLIGDFLASRHPPLRTQQAALQAIRDSLNTLIKDVPEIMVMGDHPEPRPTFVLERGMYDAPRQAVSPATPKSIMSFPDDLPPNRLGLARWLFHPDHPLTARVLVNHLWQMHFGKGLVSTTEDFGNQGTLPTHPQLLDWLSIRFRASGWDIKALHRTIVLSATYRQSSRIRPELQHLDPANELLARASRFRLPAEMIRDNALAISGLLVDQIGGPSVYPYQPEGLWDEISNKHWRYPYLEQAGDGLYRRSLYTIWKRTAPPPAMMIFDANDRTNCTVKRQTTHTPLQALVLLNDPQYLEAARVLAENILLREEKIRDQLTLASKYTLGRPPTEPERQSLNTLYEKEHRLFSEKPEAASDYLQVGYLPPRSDLDRACYAAMAVVVNALMNTDEAMSR